MGDKAKNIIEIIDVYDTIQTTNTDVVMYSIVELDISVDGELRTMR